MFFDISLDSEVWILVCIDKMDEYDTHHALSSSSGFTRLLLLATYTYLFIPTSSASGFASIAST